MKTMNMNKRSYPFYVFILALVLSTYGCTNYKKEKITMDFSDTIPQNQNNGSDTISPIYIAIASMTSPRETVSYYHDLIDYISKQIGRPIYFKQKKTYEEVNEMLSAGEVDFAFICSGAYIEEERKGNIRILAAPVINHQTYYQAYIITQKDSDIDSFKDLKDHSFAYTDPLSNTGCLYPRKDLNLLATNENQFFSKIIFTYGHDISIQMVNQEIVDAASVHSLIYNYIAETHPERVANIQIIEESELFGMPPVVSPTNLKENCFNKYRDVFLHIHEDSAGLSILNKLKIEKFVTVNDSIYDNVRHLKL